MYMYRPQPQPAPYNPRIDLSRVSNLDEYVKRFG